MSEKKYIHVRATTQARKECIECKGTKYFVSVKEKAERGVANARIKELLAEELHCNQKYLRLVKGGTTPSKTYLLDNL